jgi:N6-L-threonylcarbamoyladenine synthase
MKILAIDTSCDETAAAVTEKRNILSNVIWSQASEHAKFGGVMPSLAQRMHRERIDWVIGKALSRANVSLSEIDVVAVTEGPGLAIALEVGIKKAKEISENIGKPVVGINHIEGHLLSPLAKSKDIFLPCLGLVISGGHTELVIMERIGKYKILAKTQDDALGEALDKAARMLGLGYPGGRVLENIAKDGNVSEYPLPLPMAGREDGDAWSYSGLKTAFYRLIEGLGGQENLTRQQIINLAAAFQSRAFDHLIRILERSISKLDNQPSCLLVGGGVAANKEVRRRLRKMGKELAIKIYFPYSLKLVGDNAAMIGVATGIRLEEDPAFTKKPREVDRKPRLSVEDVQMI